MTPDITTCRAAGTEARALLCVCVCVCVCWGCKCLNGIDLREKEKEIKFAKGQKKNEKVGFSFL